MISWRYDVISCRNTHEKRRHPEMRKRRNLPSYVSRDKWLVDEKCDPEVLLTHPEVRLKVNSLTFSSNSSNSHVTTPPTDYVEVRSNNLISYLWPLTFVVVTSLCALLVLIWVWAGWNKCLANHGLFYHLIVLCRLAVSFPLWRHAAYFFTLWNTRDVFLF